MDVLKEWSGMDSFTVLYDSLRDYKDDKKFKKKIMNHSNLYFIVIDENNNIFGHYHPSEMSEMWSQEHKNGNYDKESTSQNVARDKMSPPRPRKKFKVIYYTYIT